MRRFIKKERLRSDVAGCMWVSGGVAGGKAQEKLYEPPELSLRVVRSWPFLGAIADRRRNVETLKAKRPRALEGATLQLGVRQANSHARMADRPLTRR